MSLRETFSLALKNILGSRMRTFLTMLGIIIGIASVVSVVALGRGSQEKIIADISAMGTNTIDIFPGRGFGDQRAAQITTLTVADADILAQQPYIASSTPNASSSGTLRYRNISVTAQLNGVGAGYFDVKGLEPASGGFFDENAVRRNESVVVIDENTRRRLFPIGQAEGRILLFNSRPLRVVGVVKKKDMGFGPSDTLNIWAPYTTVMYRITGSHSIASITVKVADGVMPLMAERNITRLLTARHGSKDFSTFNTDSIRQTIESATGTMTLLITGIALIALVVGGIGVMNIMLVSVTERTREIGLKIAIGARKSRILWQFLTEAAVLTSLGGLLGVLCGIGLAEMLSHVMGTAVAISAPACIVAVAFSMVIGIVFGLVPAVKASRLNPIEALRRE